MYLQDSTPDGAALPPIPGPPLLPPEDHLEHLGWPRSAVWFQTATTAPVSPAGDASILVAQPGAPPFRTTSPLGAEWNGYHVYTLGVIETALDPGVPATRKRVVYLRLWRPGHAWYGVMEARPGRRPEQSLHGPDLALATTEQIQLIDLLRTVAPPTSHHPSDLCAQIEADYWEHYALGRHARSQLAIGKRLGYSDGHIRRTWRQGRGAWPPRRLT